MDDYEVRGEPEPNESEKASQRYSASFYGRDEFLQTNGDIFDEERDNFMPKVLKLGSMSFEDVVKFMHKDKN